MYREILFYQKSELSQDSMHYFIQNDNLNTCVFGFYRYFENETSSLAATARIQIRTDLTVGENLSGSKP